MKVRQALPRDFQAWLVLAREVEHLFGPMADQEDFRRGLRQALSGMIAFCLDGEADLAGRGLAGGVLIWPPENEIAWLAVTAGGRGQGWGGLLLDHALSRLDDARAVMVRTFGPEVAEGLPARQLYLSRGFKDVKACGPNPAGIDTVLMERPARGVVGPA